MRLFGVNRTVGQERLQLLERKALLHVDAEPRWARPGRAGAVRGSLPGAQKNFSIEGGRAALEVPPSDANLRSRCRLLDGFVGRSAILVGVNLTASFCGIRPVEASRFPDWAIGAFFLRARK